MKKKYTPYVMAVFLVICMFAVFRMDTCASNGWFQEEGVWFYRDSNGNLCHGWQTINGKQYYFDPADAHMYSSGWQFIAEENKSYCFTGNGDLYTGWKKEDIFGWYYIENGLYFDGWKKDGTKWYYVKDGRMIYNRHTYLIDGKYYGFGSGGAMLTGWNKVVRTLSDGTTDTDWYYYNTNGSAPNGWLQINNVWYYFYNGWMADDGVRLDETANINYSFNDDGTMMTSKWYQDWWSGEWYYFGSNGKGLNGWIQGKNGWYYCVNGRMLYDCWYQTGTNEYSQFDENGVWIGTSSSPGE
ncbi:MAG: hypothetical protein MR729_04700 [Dorea sp.]|uniref:hypothetical protein n=1 Tax=Dorea sp. YH-dor226 TaxID=3151119 RepID=UPI003061E2FB|nr:hypothetical protein [Dorea sp.]